MKTKTTTTENTANLIFLTVSLLALIILVSYNVSAHGCFNPVGYKLF